MLLVIFLFLLPYVCGQCGQPSCGYARPYLQPQYSQYRQPLPRPIPQAMDTQLYYSGGYVQPPSVPQAINLVDKDLTPALPENIKLSAIEVEKFEKELSKLKTITGEQVPVEPTINTTSLTYIRELPYPPQPYLPRPMPYRPHPMLPKGCPVLPPQYIRPMPYMPRGYVTPNQVPLPVPATAPVYPPTTYVRPPPLNDCCGRCASPCQFHQRVYAKGSKTVEKDFVPMRDTTEAIKDSRCTSEELRDIMNKSTTRTPALSKRIIQKVAEEEFGGMFSVFCSREDFSYVARSEIFCQTSKNDINCYAFQHN